MSSEADINCNQVHKVSSFVKSNKKPVCMRCGGQHKTKQEYENCFAKRLTCRKCATVGHLAKICQRKRSSTSK